MISENDITGIVNSKLEGSSIFLVEVKVRPGNKIMVFIDGDAGVSIEDCISLSRFIESSLDREKEDFSLDVSSAGLDMPIRHIRQYNRFVGKVIEVHLVDGEKFKAVLLGFNDEEIEVKPEEKPKKKDKVVSEVNTRIIMFENIKEVKPVISFNKLNQE